MKTIAFVLAFTWTLFLTAFLPKECPPEFRIGQTYNEIKSGPCPDIATQASFKAADSVHVGYLCPSKSVMVVGDIRTGKMDAFFLWSGH